MHTCTVQYTWHRFWIFHPSKFLGSRFSTLRQHKDDARGSNLEPKKFDIPKFIVFCAVSNPIRIVKLGMWANKGDKVHELAVSWRVLSFDILRTDLRIFFLVLKMPLFKIAGIIASQRDLSRFSLSLSLSLTFCSATLNIKIRQPTDFHLRDTKGRATDWM